MRKFLFFRRAPLPPEVPGSDPGGSSLGLGEGESRQAASLGHPNPATLSRTMSEMPPTRKNPPTNPGREIMKKFLDNLMRALGGWAV